MANTPSLVNALEGLIDARLARVNTMIPGRIVAYTESTQEAEVLPLVKREVETEDGTTVESLPVIPGVPVQFPGAGAYKITWPINKGDIVMLVFSQVSLEQWLQKGSEVDPRDPRRFDLSDAVAVPGLLSFNNATDQVNSGAMVLSGNEIRIGSKDASEFVALQSELQAIRDDLEGHTHGPGTFATTSGPVTGISGAHTGIPNPSGSQKVKVD